MLRYQVVVGNIGTVVDTDDEADAYRVYREYRNRSIGNQGRAAGEPVTLFDNGEPIEEYADDTSND